MHLVGEKENNICKRICMGLIFIHILYSLVERITESIWNESSCEGLQFKLAYSPVSLSDWVNIFMLENLLFEDMLFALW